MWWSAYPKTKESNRLSAFEPCGDQGFLITFPISSVAKRKMILSVSTIIFVIDCFDGDEIRFAQDRSLILFIIVFLIFFICVENFVNIFFMLISSFIEVRSFKMGKRSSSLIILLFDFFLCSSHGPPSSAAFFDLPSDALKKAASQSLVQPIQRFVVLTPLPAFGTEKHFFHCCVLLEVWILAVSAFTQGGR